MMASLRRLNLGSSARVLFSQVDDLIKTRRRLRIGPQIYEGDSSHGDTEGTNRGGLFITH